MVSDNKRIAKNTFYLYIRMFLMMLVTLYTSRVVLATLGIIDFGIYNAVGGIVAMMGFLNGSMSNAVQRFLSFEMGRRNSEKVCEVFNAALRAHAVIAVFVLLVMEICGIWFLNEKLNIPPDRMPAARWVFQCSVAVTMFSIMQVPYNAMIISKEDMNIYAYISIVEALLKLGIVYLLLLWSIDKLKLYSILSMLVSVFITLGYILYCIRHYSEVHVRAIATRGSIRELTSFAGWNMLGEISWIFTIQGVTLLLNVFWGPAVNAARAIALQVDSAVTRFVSSFQMALNPQIIKNYAARQISDTLKLFYRGTRFSYYLLLLLSLPILFETDYLLSLWLEEVPSLTTVFCQLAIITSLVQCTSNLFATIAKAYGQIRNYQLIISLLIGMNFPLAYLMLWMGWDVRLVVSATIFIQVCVLVARMLLAKRMIAYSIRDFAKHVLAPLITVSLTSCLVPLCITLYWNEGLSRCLFNIVFTILGTLATVYCFGLTKEERLLLRESIKSYFLYRNEE